MTRCRGKPLSVLLMATFIIALCVPAYATLVPNGSFESASVDPGGGFITLGSGSTAITGWTVTGHSIDYIGGYWQASDGDRSIDLSGSGLGGIELTTAFETIVGSEYILTFDMAGNPDGPPSVKELVVQVGSVVELFTFDSTGQTRDNMGWEEKSLAFFATDTTTALIFRSILDTSGVPPYYGAALDNVSVDAVPEPSTILLLLSSIVGLTAFGRKFRK